MPENIGFFFIRLAKKVFVFGKVFVSKMYSLKKRITENEYIFENEYFSKRILFMADRKTNIWLTNTECSKTNATQANLTANDS